MMFDCLLPSFDFLYIYAYQKHPAFSRFTNIVEMDPAGISPVAASSVESIAARYDLSGRRVAGHKRGLSVIRMTDGTVKKVVVR